MRLDAVGVIEACYRAVPGHREWLEGILESLEPVSGGYGMYAVGYVLPPNETIRIQLEASWRADPAWLESGPRLTMDASPDLGRALYAPHPPVDLAFRRLRRHATAEATASMQQAPVDGADALGIFTGEPDGRGLVIGVPLRAGSRPGPRLLAQLTRISAHLTSARRLREAVATDDSAEAVLDPSGRVEHASGPAKQQEARRSLSEAVRRIERARGRARRLDPEGATALWKGLVDGRWSLVDSVETDGRRLVLARRNEPGIRDPKALTPRERDVVAYAALGHSNKYIAYLLGLAPSTVASHLKSAMKKLGLGTRREIINLVAGFGRPLADPSTR